MVCSWDKLRYEAGLVGGIGLGKGLDQCWVGLPGSKADPTSRSQTAQVASFTFAGLRRGGRNCSPWVGGPRAGTAAGLAL